MKKQHERECVSINIDKNLLQWMQKQMEEGEFESQSAAIRKCILIAKRVYENANAEEMIKFLHGKDMEKSQND